MVAKIFYLQSIMLQSTKRLRGLSVSRDRKVRASRTALTESCASRQQPSCVEFKLFKVPREPFFLDAVSICINRCLRESMTPETLAFGQVQRLTDRLKELVRKYPKGVGIFKEFLQNADDAGASSLTMILDCQTYSSTKLPLSEMAVLQGPSLVFINDKPFSAEDWKRIQSIGNSGKAHDIQKTGRFGLGFNSVYNVTDYPMLLTNGHLGVFDPHENVVPRTHSEPGAAWRIEELLQTESELLTPFQHYGLKDATNFDSTIFRLPLRTARLASASEISNEGFTKQDFEDIVAAIVDQGCGVLLFLNNVLNFYVGVIQKDGMRKSVLSVETLNPDFVEMQRAKIRSCVNGEIMNTLDYLKLFGSEEVYYEHEFKITRGLESVSIA